MRANREKSRGRRPGSRRSKRRDRNPDRGKAARSPILAIYDHLPPISSPRASLISILLPLAVRPATRFSMDRPQCPLPLPGFANGSQPASRAPATPPSSANSRFGQPVLRTALTLVRPLSPRPPPSSLIRQPRRPAGPRSCLQGRGHHEPTTLAVLGSAPEMR